MKVNYFYGVFPQKKTPPFSYKTNFVGNSAPDALQMLSNT